MTTEITTTIQTATVAADELMRAITNAVLSASADDTLPTICAIRFRPGSTPGTLMLEATNRYQASQEDIDLVDLLSVKGDLPHAHFIYRGDGWGDDQETSRREQLIKHLSEHEDHVADFPAGYVWGDADELAQLHEVKHGLPRLTPKTEIDCSVNAKDLAKLVRTLKLIIEPETKSAFGPDAPHVVIEHKPEGDRGPGKVSFMLVNNNGTDTTVSPKAVYGDFPQIDRLMADAEAAASASVTTTGSFNPAYLAVYTKVDTGNKVDTVDLAFTGPGKPALVKVGQHYRAIVIPVRKAETR